MTQSHPATQSPRWSPAFGATLLTLLCLAVMAPVAALVWSALGPASAAPYWPNGWPEVINTRPFRVVLTGLPLSLALLFGVLIYRLRVTQRRLEHDNFATAAGEERLSNPVVPPHSGDPVVPDTSPKNSTSSEPLQPNSAPVASSATAEPSSDSEPAVARFTSATRIGTPTADDEAPTSAERSGDTSRFDAPTRRDPVSSDPDNPPATSQDRDATAGQSSEPRFTAPTRKASAPRFDAATRQADNASYDVIQRLTTLPGDTSERGADDVTKADQTTEGTHGD